MVCSEKTDGKKGGEGTEAAAVSRDARTWSCSPKTTGYTNAFLTMTFIVMLASKALINGIASCLRY
jgi:hypothetical protein